MSRVVEAWQALPSDRRHFAFRAAERAQRRIDALACERLVWPEARERLEQEVAPWVVLRNVGLALLDLPALDRAFHDGRLSWAKVVLLARIVTPQHEAAWIEKARALDVRSLARLALHSPAGGPPVDDAQARPSTAVDLSACLGATDGSSHGIERALVRIEYGAVPSERRAPSRARAVPMLVAGARCIARLLDLRRLAPAFAHVPVGHSPIAARGLPDVRHLARALLSTA